MTIETLYRSRICYLGDSDLIESYAMHRDWHVCGMVVESFHGVALCGPYVEAVGPICGGVLVWEVAVEEMIKETEGLELLDPTT